MKSFLSSFVVVAIMGGTFIRAFSPVFFGSARRPKQQQQKRQKQRQQQLQPQPQPQPQQYRKRIMMDDYVSSTTSSLAMSGDGIAKGYTWHEEAFELEVSVNIPKATRAKDIHFEATPSSIELKLLQQNKNSDKSSIDDDDDEKIEILLLDPSRPLRGKVSLEGTYWVILDPEEDDHCKKDNDNDNNNNDHRKVTVTIEKQIRTPKDDFDVIDYDWKGVYLQEDDDEVSYRRYDEPEELNVREYAASLGVDIDNINMSMVDKNMFTSGLNLTQSSLESLKESGLMKEVTQQGDGTEWITDKDGNQVPFHSMGGSVPGSVPRRTNQEDCPATQIPFLDTNSPWHSAVPVDKKDNCLQEQNQTSITISSTTTTTLTQVVSEQDLETQKIAAGEKETNQTGGS